MKKTAVNVIIAINIAIFALTMNDTEMILAGAVSGNTAGNPLLWISSMFLHGGLLHIFCNMFTLYQFGPAIERDLGTKNFLGMYLGSGILGTLFQLGFASDPNISMVGASGCVCGVIGCFAVNYAKNKLLFFFVIPMRLDTFFKWFTILSLVCHFGGYLQGIGHMAHAGGIISGYMFTKYLYPKYLKRFNKGPLWS